MNEKEYVEKKCSKCRNRQNNKDLCHIVKTMKGNPKCTNEDIEIIEEVESND